MRACKYPYQRYDVGTLYVLLAIQRYLMGVKMTPDYDPYLSSFVLRGKSLALLLWPILNSLAFRCQNDTQRQHLITNSYVNDTQNFCKYL